jgi:hypothetical protein
MEKFEYTWMYQKFEPDSYGNMHVNDLSTPLKKLQNTLNEFGANGWELVSTTRLDHQGVGYTICAFLKRKIQ